MAQGKTRGRLFIAAPDIAAGDAVGNHCLGLGKAAKRMGYDVRLHARSYKVENVAINPLEALMSEIRAEDTLLLSYSIYEPLLVELLECNAYKIAYFHGITPPQLLQLYDPVTADLCRAGLAQIDQLAKCNRIVSNSSASAEVLKSYGIAQTVTVLPPFTQDCTTISHKLRTPAASEVRNDRSRPVRLLMVGRVVPHKNIEAGIRGVSLLRRTGMRVELDIVGSTPCPDYLGALEEVVADSNLGDAVHFRGHVSDEERNTIYRTSDILLHCSRHEGFCIPLFEAMQIGLPIVVSPETAATGTSDSTIHLVADGPDEICEKIMDWSQYPESSLARVSSGIKKARQLFDAISDKHLQSALFSKGKVGESCAKS